MTLVEGRPTGLMRLFLRAPVGLYRVGLGRLLGHRFLYLAHRGRTSGKRRDVVLEVVRFDPAGPEAFVMSAWGNRSDWLQNLHSAPALEVRIGRMRWSRPRHRLLDAAEAAALLSDYGRRHPRAWKALAPGLGLSSELSVATVEEAVERFPAVAFRPRHGATATEEKAAGYRRTRYRIAPFRDSVRTSAVDPAG